MHDLQNIGFVFIVILVAWLLFKIIKKIVLAVIVIVILGAVALYVYLKFF